MCNGFSSNNGFGFNNVGFNNGFHDDFNGFGFNNGNNCCHCCHCCHCHNCNQGRRINVREIIRGDLAIRRGIEDTERGLLEMEDGLGIRFPGCQLRQRHRHNNCFNSSFNSGHNIF